MYNQKKIPLEYGILYSESATQTAETAWYETIESRDEAVEYIKENGHIEGSNLFSQRGKMIEIHSFSIINANTYYYTRSK